MQRHCHTGKPDPERVSEITKYVHVKYHVYKQGQQEGRNGEREDGTGKGADARTQRS